MVYRISEDMKKRLARYSSLETGESMVGYVVLTFLTLDLGAFASCMSKKIMGTCLALSFVAAFSKVMAFMDTSFFNGRSCAQVASTLPLRFQVGGLRIMNDEILVTLTLNDIQVAVRLLAMGTQLGLGAVLYLSISDVGQEADWEKQRLKELLWATCISVFIHSWLSCALLFFAVGCFLYHRLVDLVGACTNLLYTGRFEQRAIRRISPYGGGPLIERLSVMLRMDAIARMWQSHHRRHLGFSVVDAQTNRDSCGLQGYWFYSMKELVQIVRKQLDDLSDDVSSDPDEYSHLHEGQGTMKMALASLLELSKKRDPHQNCRYSRKSGEMGRHMQDLPLLGRCHNDVDAGRDFARAEGYLLMLQVVQCCPRNGPEVQLAARILSGFAWGLSVLPWQHDREPDDKDFILNMLCDGDFCYCTKELLDELLGLLGRRAPRTGGNVSPCSGQDIRSFQEATISALCSFAHAASDVHAQAMHGERCKQDASTANHQSDGSDCTITVCNAFTTWCPFGWLLEKQMPDFGPADNTWVKAVTSVLDNQAAVDILLSYATNELNVSRRVVGDAIRTLSSLWSCQVIYWHRFDKRMPRDFPPPLADISKLPKHEEVRSKLESLVRESAADGSPVSPFVKLHLAKILISQEIRGRQIDLDITDLLLHCLRYWRQAVGNPLLDCFACEVMETLLDVLVTSADSEHKLAIIGRMEGSPGGVDCLKLMTLTTVAPIRAVRLQQNNFDSLLSEYLSKEKVNDWCGDWKEDYVTDCAGTAAGLLAYCLSVENGPNFITAHDDKFLKIAVAHATVDSQARIEKPFVKSVLGRFKRAFNNGLGPLWFFVPLGHPAWQPLQDWHEDIHESHREDSQNVWLEALNRDVLALVHRRNVAKLIAVVLGRSFGAPHLSPVLDKLRERREVPSLILPTPRGLQEFKMRCQQETEAQIQKI
ncbi:hypothetical protein CBR_g55412 [Chara braunii]|uniref:Uncharacterized protein n=1 Tax=Chara braunii TaxID=69332 RepID=A0A388K7S0_CHABU|nr:hypothetical protein CBR_g55412 [Chara braunii]|eukprot:GBG66069.1 hypothetical protein CBR_g55412 [Chara braunii]